MTRMQGTDDPAGGLALLVETEDRLEAMIAERREEAARLVAEARREAATRLAELAAGLAAEEESIRAGIQSRAREEIAAAVAGAERRARRFREVPEARVETLARHVVERVVAPTGGAA